MNGINNISKLRKEILRDQIKKIRSQLPAETIHLCGQLFIKQLEQWPVYLQARTVMIYIAVRGEAETSFIADDIQNKRKTLIVPVCKEEEGKMFASELHSLDELTTGKYGIPEPETVFYRPFDPKKIDLIIIPCIACSKKGDRLGYGGGYYDQFLKKLDPDCAKAALLYPFQIHESLPAEVHDEQVDYLITPAEIINAKYQ